MQCLCGMMERVSVAHSDQTAKKPKKLSKKVGKLTDHKRMLSPGNETTINLLKVWLKNLWNQKVWKISKAFFLLLLSILQKKTAHFYNNYWLFSRVTHTYGSFKLDSQNLIQFLILNSNIMLILTWVYYSGRTNINEIYG